MDVLRPGDRRRAALDRLRAERDRLLQEIDEAGTARLTVDETIARLAARLREDVDRVQHRVLAFSRPDVVPESLPTVDLAFLMWMQPDFEKTLRARLKSLLPASAPPLASRPATIEKLKTRLAELEHEEEAAVLKLIETGHMVERRAELDLAAVSAAWDEADAAAA